MNCNFKHKNIIKISSLIALVCAGFNVISEFFIYNGEFIPDVTTILLLLLYVIPYILLLLCVYALRKEKHIKLFCLLSYGILAAHRLFSVIRGIVYLGWLSVSTDITQYYNMASGIPFIVLLFYAFKGFKSKSSAIIATTLCVLDRMFVILISWQLYIQAELFIELFRGIIGNIGCIILYIIWLIISLRIGASQNLAEPYSKASQETEKFNPEQDLQLLNDKLGQGAITEQEYQIKRAELIEKL